MAQQSPALAALNEFRLCETTPFGHLDPNDFALDAMEEAYAILLVLRNLATEADQELPTRPVHLRKALDGVMTLMSLAEFARQQNREAR